MLFTTESCNDVSRVQGGQIKSIREYNAAIHLIVRVYIGEWRNIHHDQLLQVRCECTRCVEHVILKEVRKSFGV